MARKQLITVDFIRSYFAGSRYGFVTTPGGGIHLYVESVDPENDARRFSAALEVEASLYKAALQVGMLYSLETSQFLTEQDIAEDDYVQGVFEQTVNTPPRLHLNRWLTPTPPVPSGTAKRVTFYSYKGGVGRSTALAFVAICLARSGKRVVVIDFDLEAPGLTSLFLDEANCPPKGVVDYLLEKPALEDDLSAEVLNRLYLAQPSGFEGASNIHVMPAGHLSGGFEALSQNASYVEKLSYLDIDILERSSSSDQDAPLAQLFRDIGQAVNPDYILVDSRTGLADVGGSLLFQYSDLVVSLLYNHPQHLVGANLLMNSLARYQAAGMSCPKVLWVHTLLRHHPESPEGRAFHTGLSLFLDQGYSRYGLHPAPAQNLVLRSDEKGSALEYILRLETLEQLSVRTFQDNRVLTDYQRLAREIEKMTAVSYAVDRQPQLALEDKLGALGELRHASLNMSPDLFLADPEIRQALTYPVVYVDRHFIPIMVELLKLQEMVISVPAACVGTPTAGEAQWVSVWMSHCLEAMRHSLPDVMLRVDIADQSFDISTALRTLDAIDRQLAESERKVTLVFPNPDIWMGLPSNALSALVALFSSRPTASLTIKVFVPDPGLLVGLGAFGKHVGANGAASWLPIVLSALCRQSPKLEAWLKNEAKLRIYPAHHGGLYVQDQPESQLISTAESLFGVQLHPEVPRVSMLTWLSRHVRLPEEPQAISLLKLIHRALDLDMESENATRSSSSLIPAEAVLTAWVSLCKDWLTGQTQDQLRDLANQLSLHTLGRVLTSDELTRLWNQDVVLALRTMVSRVVASPITDDALLHLVEPVWYGLHGSEFAANSHY